MKSQDASIDIITYACMMIASESSFRSTWLRNKRLKSPRTWPFEFFIEDLITILKIMIFLIINIGLSANIFAVHVEKQQIGEGWAAVDSTTG